MFRNAAMCGGYCYPHDSWSKKDEIASLDEQEKILKAKLATIRHMKDSVKEKLAEKK